MLMEKNASYLVIDQHFCFSSKKTSEILFTIPRNYLFDINVSNVSKLYVNNMFAK